MKIPLTNIFSQTIFVLSFLDCNHLNPFISCAVWFWNVLFSDTFTKTNLVLYLARSFWLVVVLHTFSSMSFFTVIKTLFFPNAVSHLVPSSQGLEIVILDLCLSNFAVKLWLKDSFDKICSVLLTLTGFSLFCTKQQILLNVIVLHCETWSSFAQFHCWNANKTSTCCRKIIKMNYQKY